MKHAIAPIFVSLVIYAPVHVFFQNLPLKCWPGYVHDIYDVNYLSTGEPLVVDLEKSAINFDEYNSKVNRTQTKAELRKSLSDYLLGKINILGRTPSTWGYSLEWEHTKQLLVTKTVKDMIIQAGREVWTADQVESTFFEELQVWVKLNRLVIALQTYVLHTPAYAAHVENEMFQKAFRGDQEAFDFCMVNFAACRIEMKSFYMIKAMEGQSEYFHEDLLKFTDFSSYLPLF